MALCVWGGGGGMGVGGYRTIMVLLFHLMDTAHFLSGDKSIIVISSQHMNPFMPCGFFYLNCLGWSFSGRRDVWLVSILTMFYRNTCIYCIVCRS